MRKAPTLLEAAQAFFQELERELAEWEEAKTSDWQSSWLFAKEREYRISQMKIVLNSCESGDLRRAIAKAERTTRKAA